MCFKGTLSQVKVLRKEEKSFDDPTQAPCIYSNKVAKFKLIGWM